MVGLQIVGILQSEDRLEPRTPNWRPEDDLPLLGRYFAAQAAPPLGKAPVAEFNSKAFLSAHEGVQGCRQTAWISVLPRWQPLDVCSASCLTTSSSSYLALGIRPFRPTASTESPAELSCPCLKGTQILTRKKASGGRCQLPGLPAQGRDMHTRTPTLIINARSFFPATPKSTTFP